MLFLSLLKTTYGKVSDHPTLLKRIWSVPPPQGVKILGVFFLFGAYDGAIIFEASDFRAAKDFIMKIAAQGVYRIETMGAIPAEEL